VGMKWEWTGSYVDDISPRTDLDTRPILAI